MKNIIEVNNVSFEYITDENTLKAIDNLDLQVKEGEFVAIIGHNGSGKSTLSKNLNAILFPTEGNILINKMDTREEDKLWDIRQTAGMVFQNPDNQIVATIVEEDVAFGPENLGVEPTLIRERVEDALKSVGIYELKDRQPHLLSGGQKQRVAIARALALEPKVLLCDEATSALDPNTTKSILALLQDINEKMNITIIVVTHQMEVVKQICTKVAVMEGGRVLEIENTEDLFLNNTAGLKALMGDEQIVLPEGTNIKIIFPKEIANQNIITNMARTLDFDFNISYGKLEKFREDVLGSLIITVKDHYANAVKRYLDEKNIKWEEIKNDK